MGSRKDHKEGVMERLKRALRERWLAFRWALKVRRDYLRTMRAIRRHCR